MKNNSQGNILVKNYNLGFTLFELVVVICIISTLAVVATGYYRKLLVQVEQTTVEYNVGTLRSALAMQFAAYYVAGRRDELPALIDSNPMEMLAQKPKNYLGSYFSGQQQNLPVGNWYFDSEKKLLVYLVKNSAYFSSPLTGKPRIRFKIQPVYADTVKGEQIKNYICGLELKSLEPYRWLPPIVLDKIERLVQVKGD
ncbi:type II secretion system protein [Geopsychrobacter electrodiphilus]|uniref:type II secretion system protein n=1 Tax=Geopsychrobacter electrodiphilus TaxID=225196 RepID=UPI00037C9571|nr:prepilin-type N-terminal cleavage/methylation domain-containing protein [Geopsychrobacter electrodiphilus]